MTDDQQPEERPGFPTLRDALEDWHQRRGVKDIIANDIPDELPPIPVGPQTYSHAEAVEDVDGNITGIIQPTGPVFIAPAIYPKTDRSNTNE